MFGWGVYIRSIYEEEFASICVGSLIISCNPSCEVTLSLVLPSKLVLLHQFEDLALQSRIAVDRKEFFVLEIPTSF